MEGSETEGSQNGSGVQESANGLKESSDKHLKPPPMHGKTTLARKFSPLQIKKQKLNLAALVSDAQSLVPMTSQIFGCLDILPRVMATPTPQKLVPLAQGSLGALEALDIVLSLS